MLFVKQAKNSSLEDFVLAFPTVWSVILSYIHKLTSIQFILKS